MADLHDNNVSLFPYPDSSYGSKAKNVTRTNSALIIRQ